MTRAQRSMLEVFNDAYPKAVAHTSDLGSIHTWRWLIDHKLIAGNLITAAGRHAIAPGEQG